MAKYNIYRLREDKVELAETKLIEGGYKQVALHTVGDYEIKAFFTETPKLSKLWWVEQYKIFFKPFESKQNQVYSGALIATNSHSGQSFLIALGRTHFYIQNSIDFGFGLKVAERIGSAKGAKGKSSKYFGGKTSKSITSFAGDTELSFKPGEATDYVKLKAQNPDKWGKAYIHFGTSVQFGGINYEVEQLDKLLSDLEESLLDQPSFTLPLLLPVKDSYVAHGLDIDVAEAISNSSTSIGVVDFELYGVDFVFAQQTHARLHFKEMQSGEINELNVAEVKKFADENSIDLRTALREIKVKLYINDTAKFTVDLIALLDYVGDSEYLLHRGKWYIFSQSFHESLQNLVATVPVERSLITFSKAEFRIWQKAHQNETINYRERYAINKIITSGKGLQDFDRSLDYKLLNKKKMSLEVSDIYDPAEAEINVVKIGDAKDFGYAFDQAALTLEHTRANQYEFEDGTKINIRKLRLTLISTRVNIPKNASDINSLIFQIKLSELLALAKDRDVELIVAFAKYEV
jgi:uncharacterized protein (TIGR04141 family)